MEIIKKKIVTQMNPVNKTFMIFVRSNIETSVHKEKKKII